MVGLCEIKLSSICTLRKELMQSNYSKILNMMNLHFSQTKFLNFSDFAIYTTFPLEQCFAKQLLVIYAGTINIFILESLIYYTGIINIL